MLGMQSVASVCNEFIDLGIFWPQAIDRAKKTHANRAAKFSWGEILGLQLLDLDPTIHADRDDPLSTYSQKWAFFDSPSPLHAL